MLDEKTSFLQKETFFQKKEKKENEAAFYTLGADFPPNLHCNAAVGDDRL